MKTVKVPEYECLRCGYKWIPRSERVPRRCPQCKSRYWDRKVERQTVVDAQKKRWGKIYS